MSNLEENFHQKLIVAIHMRVNKKNNYILLSKNKHTPYIYLYKFIFYDEV